MNPCLNCGACCMVLPVSFPDADGAQVPRNLIAPDVLPGHTKMRRRPDGACIALRGSAPDSPRCSIYKRRPVGCRAFQPSTTETPNPYCDDSRRRFGLAPLF